VKKANELHELHEKKEKMGQVFLFYRVAFQFPVQVEVICPAFSDRPAIVPSRKLLEITEPL
jgi:hypothetical protein